MVLIHLYLACRRMNVAVMPILNVTGPLTTSYMAYAAIANWYLKVGRGAESDYKLMRTPLAKGDKPLRGLALTSPAPSRQRRA